MNQNDTIQFDFLTLDDKYFERPALLRRCLTKLESPSIPEWEKSICQFILDWLDPKDSILLKTSGSTGKPKVIQASKAAMVTSARLTQQAFDLKENDKALLCLPANYIAGKMMIVRAFVCKLNLLTVEPTSDPLGSVSRHFFKFVAMVPLQLVHYQKTCSREQCLSYFRQIDTLLVGGASISKNTESFIHDLPCKSFHTYGMTETLSHVAFRRIQPKVTKYTTLPGITVSSNSDNCLVIKTPHLDIGTLKTNDIAQIHSETEFTLIGRIDNVINTGGIKVHPEVVERKIEAHFKQYPILVFPSENEKLGQQVNLAIEAKYDAHIEQQIKAVLQNLRTLNRYDHPKRILFMERFVYTESGKIQRNKTIQELTKKL